MCRQTAVQRPTGWTCSDGVELQYALSHSADIVCQTPSLSIFAVVGSLRRDRRLLPLASLAHAAVDHRVCEQTIADS